MDYSLSIDKSLSKFDSLSDDDKRYYLNENQSGMLAEYRPLLTINEPIPIEILIEILDALDDLFFKLLRTKYAHLVD